MTSQVLMWCVFGITVISGLFIDLFVLHRKAHEIQFKEAFTWSIVWISLALLFNLGIYIVLGPEIALEFITGYIIEKTLSFDNLFVFLLIFSYFRVPAIYQHRVLFWGILGAIFMRAIMIAAGVTLINMFHWVIYVFGVFLIFTGVKMALGKDKKIDPEKSRVLKLCKRLIPFTDRYEKEHFFIKKKGRHYATLLFMVLITIEITDVVFAVDSIPAILAITTDPFVVYTSNIFAIMGLRALYFALAAFMKLFQYLHYGLSIILVFVGVKMMISDFFEIPLMISLGVVICLLFFSVVASLLFGQKKEDVKV